jgi:hypothetical protein
MEDYNVKMLSLEYVSSGNNIHLQNSHRWGYERCCWPSSRFVYLRIENVVAVVVEISASHLSFDFY